MSEVMEQLKRMTDETTSAVQEQSRGIAEVNTALNTFNQSTNDNAKTAVESGNVAGKLKNEFTRFQTVIDDLKSLV